MGTEQIIHSFVSSGLGGVIYFLLICATVSSGLLTALWTAKRSHLSILGLTLTALCGFFTALLALFGACPGR